MHIVIIHFFGYLLSFYVISLFSFCYLFFLSLLCICLLVVKNANKKNKGSLSGSLILYKVNKSCEVIAVKLVARLHLFND